MYSAFAEVVESNGVVELTDEQHELLAESLSMLAIVPRTINMLEMHGIFTVEDLLMRRKEELLEFSNFGETTLRQIYDALEAAGLPVPPGARVTARQRAKDSDIRRVLARRSQGLFDDLES